ncbi:MAG: cysteine--tRNA ligase [Thermoplasmata archaeon]
MTLKLYNTLVGEKETFEPLKDTVRIYSCGQTIYEDMHVGNAKTYSAWDVLTRYLEWKGYQIFHVMNITDVGHLTDDADEGEDKIAKSAREKELEPMELVTKQVIKFYIEMDKLNMCRANVFPRATGHMVEMMEAVKKMMDNGYAYEVNGSVYFDVPKFAEDYGYPVLGGRKVDDLLVGAGGRVSDQQLKEKRSPLDFALWIKAPPEHLMRWPSPWGEGYPGWHLECSVMGDKYLGKTFDIHAGGIDHIFPHHPNERAQNIAMNDLDEEPIKYWIHSSHITVEGKKMSKSKGNYYTVEDLLKKYDPNVLRTFFAGIHYRSHSDFSLDALEEAEIKLDKMENTIRLVHESQGGENDELADMICRVRKEFQDAMDEDLNTPLALSKLLAFSKQINISLDNQKEMLEEAVDTLKELSGVLGIELQEKKEDINAGPYIDLLLSTREILRSKKQFQLADKIRDELQSLGIEVEDADNGSKWYRK